MRFQHEGMTLWYGEPDTPSPSGTIDPGIETIVTVGVQPADASNKIAVLYSVNRGSDEKAKVRWLRNDTSKKTQYFEARFPSFRAGDEVRYTVVCDCAGRMLPAREDLKRAYTDLRVTRNGKTNTGDKPVKEPEKEKEHSHAPEPERSKEICSISREPEPITRTDPFVIRGRIFKANGCPFVGGSVRAYDNHLRDPKLLGKAITDEKGSYEIQYKNEQLDLSLKSSAHLFIAVFGTDEEGLMVSRIFFDAPPIVTINLSLPGEYQPASEFEILMLVIKPWREETPMQDLTEDSKHQDITFLSAETGIDRQLIGFLILAHRLAVQTQLPAVIFYGFARKGLPLDLPALITYRIEVLRKALEHAIEDNIIPTQTADSIAEVLESLQRHIVGQAVEAKPVDGGYSLGDLLSSVQIPADKQTTLMAMYFKHDGPIEEFWTKRLREHHAFQEPGTVENIQRTMQLGALTGNHLPLIQELKRSYEVSSPRDLVKLDATLLADLINKQVDGKAIGVPADIPGATQEEKVANYVNGITHVLQAAFPTDVVAQIAAKAPEINIDATRRTTISQFFTNSQDFDLRRPVDKYITEHASTAFQGIEESERPNVVAEAKRLQRVFQISTGPESMTALLGSNFDSALAIANTPRRSFIEQMKVKLGSEQQAGLVYDRAQHVSARNLHVYTLVHQALYDAHLMVTGTTAEDYSEAIKKVPSLAELFGSMDLCDCEHCCSVFSPAAYFVDLLHCVLGKGNKNNLNAGGKMPLDLLLMRRPDLEHIQLTCENTNTVLPYVDLVNEILEYYVAHKTLDANAVHNIEDVTAAELSASPQYVNEDAYKELSSAVYPFTLPFDQPLEVARLYFEHFGTSRYEVVEIFKKDDNPPTIHAIDSECLKISAKEYVILTGQNFDPNVVETATPLREFYGYVSDDVIRSDNNVDVTKKWKEWLVDIPEFLHRTGITYVDVIEILKTAFINPNLPKGEALQTFRQIPISFASLNALVQSNFAAPSQEIINALQQNNLTLDKLKEWSEKHFQKVQKLIVLDAPSSKCDINMTRILHLDGSVLDDDELSKLHRFIRLWRKLDFKLPELDKTFTALQGVDITPDFLHKLSKVKRLKTTLNLPLVQILSFWSDIDTFGDESLYEKLFLSKAAQKLDPVFSRNADESVLTNPNETISTHAPAILAALRISAADLSLIRDDAKLADEKSELNLANVSLLFRYSLLAKGLKCPIGDFIALKSLSGIDPFSTPCATTRFVEIIKKVRQSDFSVSQLDYIYRNLSEPSSGPTIQRENLLPIAKALRDGLTIINENNADAKDSSPELTRNKLGTIFDGSIVDQVLRLIDGSVVYTATLNQLPSEISKSDNNVIGIDPNKIPDPLKKRITFNAKNKLLQFKGPMTTVEQDQLIVTPEFDYNSALKDIYQQPRTLLKDILGGILDISDLTAEGAISRLLEVSSLDEKGESNTNSITDKLRYFLSKFLPYLRERLSRSFVKQSIAENLKLEVSMVELLLERLGSSKVMMDCLALNKTGLTATYLSSTNPPTTRVDSVVTFDGKEPADGKAIPEDIQNASWTGMLLIPNNGDYTFYINANGEARLWIGESQNPIIESKSAGEVASTPITLKAGQLYNIRFELLKLPSNALSIASLGWSSATTPKDFIPASNLYPSSTLDNFIHSFTLIHKIALLINGFKLSVKEIEYLSHKDHKHDFAGSDPISKDFVDFDLNGLPLKPGDFKPAHFKQWERLFNYVMLRNSLPQKYITLIDAFGASFFAANLETLPASPENDNRKKEAYEDAKQKLISTTGWDERSFRALIADNAFNLSAKDFQNEIWLLRLQACMRLIKRLGASVEQLFKWSVSTPDMSQAQDVKNTAKGKYDDETWLSVAKPLNDQLRESQKAALVNYLLPRIPLSDSNQLFEYFLIDANMSACMMTSRTKQAISSVQLFVQRCLMNLERRDDQPELSVNPSAIDAEQWKWRKNYRVWEANMKVFLTPENWLEEELRDNKTPFFKDLESELLQNDLNMESAEQAFLSYLNKLDEVAQLEICGMYQPPEGEGIAKEDTLYVFGRTPNTPHVYYFRKMENGKTWTPWEKVQVDIEGDHLLPVIWNRHLYLFWPIFAEKSLSAESTTGPPPARFLQIKLAWSVYKNNQWMPKQISSQFIISKEQDAKDSTIIPKNQHSFKAIANSDGTLDIQVFCDFRPWGNQPLHIAEFRLSGCQGRVKVRYQNWYFNDPYRKFGDGNDPYLLDLKYVNESECRDVEIFNKEYGLVVPPNTVAENMTFKEKANNEILTLPSDDLTIEAFDRTPTTFRLIHPHQSDQFRLQSPFFYQDDQRCYFVTSRETVELVTRIKNPDLVIPEIPHKFPNEVFVQHYADLVSQPAERKFDIGSYREFSQIDLSNGVFNESIKESLANLPR